tara:strand:+ start:65 stop:313 length:249 start_codon:yes stop_codon:yes gene_type:complete
MSKLSKEEQKISDKMDEHFERNSIYINNTEYQIIYEALSNYINNKTIQKSDYIIEKTYLLIDDIEQKIDEIFADIESNFEKW